ncbi:hypothetical protein FHR99_001138 [Litorivivens lipolytica]|uniref:Cysteine dioxygenase n=1 Tax=Litorivivens lipolytica TaxID=1524264 RepID=A0A7W4W4V0_9GAMM|nr:hypothetical protein [Litorivivens lipolytica]MBB3046902.1 hypothetical protein [Litorivivens lipolytica]
MSDHLPCKIIRGDKEHPYLERYYLCSVLGRRFYLHRFLGGDVDEALHNHPWKKSNSFLLTGGYRECISRRRGTDDYRQLSIESRQLKAGHLNRIDADCLHRIVEAKPETWTVFWHTIPRVQPWGFVVDDENGENRFEEYANGRGADWYKRAPKGKRCEERLAFR